MRGKMIGYIVVGGGTHGGYSLGREGVLWIGDHVTMFSDRKQAQRAIHRTVDYAASRRFQWDTVSMSIRRVRRAK